MVSRDSVVHRPARRLCLAVPDLCGLALLINCGLLSIAGGRVPGTQDALLFARQKHEFRHLRTWQGLAVAADGKYLAGTADDGAVHVWDLSAGSLAYAFQASAKPFRSMAFSPDGKRLATNIAEGTKFWDFKAGREGLSVAEGGSLVFLPKQNAFVSSDGINRLEIRDAETGRSLRKLGFAGLRGHYAGVLALNPEGTILATSGDKTIKLWESDKLVEIMALKGHEKFIQGICFSPDGKTIASASFDRTARIFDVKTGEELHKISFAKYHPICLAFSPDGKWLAIGCASKTGSVSIRETKTFREVLSLECGHSATNVFFTPQGTLVNSAGPKVQVWELSEKPFPAKK